MDDTVQPPAEDDANKPFFLTYHTGDVPVEVWEHILYMVDFPTLKACAITCRTFLRRSRHHLYRHAYLKNFHDAKLLVRALRKDPDSRGAVRELLLDFPAATKPAGPVIKYLFPMLHNLRRLHIRSFTSIHPEFYTALSAVSQAVTGLCLVWCNFKEIAEFTRIVLALPNLRDLAIYPGVFANITAADDQGDGDVDVSAIPLSSIVMQEESWRFATGPLGRWLSKTSTPQCLEKLYMRPDVHSSRTSRDFIHLAKHCLHTLVLDLSRLDEPILLPQAFALKSLQVDATTANIDACLDLIRSLPDGSLNDLSLIFKHVHGYSASAPKKIPWAEMSRIAALDRVLSISQLSSLRRFRIQFRYYSVWTMLTVPSQESREHIMKKWLPSVDARLWVDDFGDTFYFEPRRLS